MADSTDKRTGMWSTLAGIATSFLPTLFSGAFKRADPMRGVREAALRELSPETQLGYADQFFSGMTRSPMYSRARSAVNSSSAAMRTAMAQRLGLTGMNMSGIGALHAGSAASNYHTGLANIDAMLWERALESARGTQSARAGVLSQPQRSWGSELTGLGFQTAMPLLFKYLQSLDKPKPGTD